MALPLTETDKFLLLHALGAPETRDRVSALLDLAGTGNMTGPASATDNALVRFDGTTGALVQNSVAVLSDAGALSGLTGISQSSGQILAADGTVGAPGISFSADADNGLYRVGVNSIGLAIGGAQTALFNPTFTYNAVQLQSADGSAALPQYAFNSDADTGFYRIGANNIGASVGGSNILSISATEFLFGSRLAVVDGSAASPAFSFSADGDNGFYRSGSNAIGVSSGGTQIGHFSATSLFLLGTDAVPFTIKNAAGDSSGLKLSAGVSGPRIIHQFNEVLSIGTNNLVYQTISGGGAFTFGESGNAQTHAFRGNGLQLIHSSATGEFQITRGNSTGVLSICGDSGSAGGEVELYGSAHASAANQIRILSNGTQVLTAQAAFIGMHTTGSSDVALTVSGTALTGTTQYVTVGTTRFNSAATTAGVVFEAEARTENASFTMNRLLSFNAATISKGASNTIDRTINYGGALQTAGSSNAFMSDNLTFSGDYFIHSTSTRPSLLSGILTVTSASGDIAAFTSTGVNGGVTKWNTSGTLIGYAGSAFQTSTGFTSTEMSYTAVTNVYLSSNNGSSGYAVKLDTAGTMSLLGSGSTQFSLVQGGQLRGASGSAGTPTYSYGADTDTGMYRIGADSIGFSTGGTQRLAIDAGGNMAIGTAALATNATDGFIYASTSAGAPTGTPTTFTGRAPIHIDTTNGRFYAYYGGAWHFIALA